MKPGKVLRIANELVAGKGNARSVLAWKILQPGNRRFKYPLNAESLVYDIGGFEGDYTAEIRRLFGCVVYIFEPDPESFSGLEARFKGDPQVVLIKGALSSKDGSATLQTAGEASRLLGTTDGQGTCVSLINAVDFIVNHNHSQIDLMKINIEGAEYELITALLEAGLHRRIRNFLIQFHPFGVDYRARYEKITEKLISTHRRDWCFPFLWESWSIRQA